MADEKLSYEAARDELVAVVANESGGASLADSMALWKRGEELARVCQEFLDGAKAEVAEARAAEGTQQRG